MDPRPFAYKANALARLSYIGTKIIEILEGLKCYRNSFSVFSASLFIAKVNAKKAMKYIPRQKLKVLMGMFFGTAIVGILMGLHSNTLMITFLGVINLCLGGFFGWVFLTQKPRLKDKRKKKR